MSDASLQKIKTNVATQVDDSVYWQITFEIRNMNVLSSRQIEQLTLLSNEQLLKIIEIYNRVMINVFSNETDAQRLRSFLWRILEHQIRSAFVPHYGVLANEYI